MGNKRFDARADLRAKQQENGPKSFEIGPPEIGPLNWTTPFDADSSQIQSISELSSEPGAPRTRTLIRLAACQRRVESLLS